ncbi:MAG: hypothetical protein ACNA7E_01000, partial [Wenzhouxiangellaceae bacterium]
MNISELCASRSFLRAWLVQFYVAMHKIGALISAGLKPHGSKSAKIPPGPGVSNPPSPARICTGSRGPVSFSPICAAR